MNGWLLPVLPVLLQFGRPDARLTAFVGVHVVRTDTAAILANQTVLVDGDRIRWVGPARQASIPATARRIDARGRYLLPGFADMHVHLGDRRDLLTYIANGITTVRVMSGSPAVLAWRDSVRAGELTGPRIITAGPILDGDPPSQPGMVVLREAREGRDEVERQVRAGYDFIKVYNSLPRAVYDTILAAARRAGVPVAGHVPFAVGLFHALRGGQRSIEHLRGYISELVPSDAPVQPQASLKSRSLAWAYVDTSRFDRLARETAALGVWNVPTLAVTQELLAPPERWDAMDRRGVYRYLGPDATFDRATVPWLRDFAPDDYRQVQLGVEFQRQFVLRLHRAGAPLLAGTDTNLQGYALFDELRQFVVAGLTPWETLVVATRNAARFVGEEDSRGSVTVGQVADLQLVDGNPVADLRALRRRSGVMVRGRWYSRADLARALEEVAASYRSPR